MPVLTTHVDPDSDTFRANREAQLAVLKQLDEQLELAIAGGGERYQQRHRDRGQAAGPRADRAAGRPGQPVPRAVPAGRLGDRLHRRRQHRDRHRGDLRGRVRDHRARPDRPGRRDEPVLAAQDPARAGDRPAEPAAGDEPGGVGRRRPADPGRPVRPGRADLPRADRAVRTGHPHGGAGVRQLHRRRRLRARHVRLRGPGGRPGQGVPRRAAAGEDGHRRGIRRRVAGRRRDALAGLRPVRLLRRRRTRRDPPRPRHHGPDQLAQAGTRRRAR